MMENTFKKCYNEFQRNVYKILWTYKIVKQGDDEYSGTDYLA